MEQVDSSSINSHSIKMKQFLRNTSDCLQSSIPPACVIPRVRMVKFLAYATVACVGFFFFTSALLFIPSRVDDGTPMTVGIGHHHYSMERSSDNKTVLEVIKQQRSNRRSIASVNSQLERQKRRKQHVFDVCRKLNASGQLLSANKTATPFHFRAIFVDDERQMMYCEVPKVACTNWKRILLLLTGKMNTTRAEDLRSNEVHSTLEKAYLRRLNTYTMEEIQHRLDSYYKFLFVREPFERILSAYHNKFTSKYNGIFKRSFGRKIVRNYREKPTNESLQEGHDVTFPEFVTYLLDPKTTKQNPFNAHWRQFYELCHPCFVHYDFIGKYETLKEDAELVLTQLGVQEIMSFPIADPRRVKTSDLIAQKFANISSSDIDRLWQLYSIDFEMFGYPFPSTATTESNF